MLARELLAIVREDFLDDVSDEVYPQEDLYRWSNAFLLREAATAQREACYRQDLRHLFDATTPAICAITLVEGQRAYPLDARILRLERVALWGARLAHTTAPYLDAVAAGWRTATGAPTAFAVVGTQLTLNRAPLAADAGATLALEVWREPLAAPGLEDALEWTRSPEKLGHWIAHRAFVRPYAATFDAELAKYHLAQFESAFGREVPAAARTELLTDPAEVWFAPVAASRAARYTCGDFDTGE